MATDVKTANGNLATQEFNWKSQPIDHPTYQYVRVDPQNAPGAAKVTATSGPKSFKYTISKDQILNMAKCYIYYNVSVAAQAGTKAAFIPANTFGEISQVRVATKSGTELLNLLGSNLYMETARPIGTQFEDFMTNDVKSALYPSNALATANVLPTVAGVQSTTYKNYTEQQYEIISAAATVFNYNRLFYFGYLLESIMDYDKNLPISEDVSIEFFFDAVRNGYQAVLADRTLPAALQGDVTISVPQMYLAVETDETAMAQIWEKVRSPGGFAVELDWIRHEEKSFTNQTTNSFEINLDGTDGHVVKDVMWTVCSAAQFNVPEQYDHSNINTELVPAKINSYQTYINNKPIQNYTLDCRIRATASDTAGDGAPTGDDWQVNKRFCKGSVIQNHGQYASKWFHIDDFRYSNGPLNDSKLTISRTNIANGAPLGAFKWTAKATMASNAVTYNHHGFVRTKKTLRCLPNKMEVLA